MRSANSQIAIEKLDTEIKNQNWMMKAKIDIKISTFNTPQTNGKILELITSAETTGQYIISIQEHRAIHDEIIITEQPYGN